MKAASWEIRKQVESSVCMEALIAGAGDVFLVLWKDSVRKPGNNNPVMTSYMKSSQKGLSCLRLVENRSRQYLELKKILRNKRRKWGKGRKVMFTENSLCARCCGKNSDKLVTVSLQCISFAKLNVFLQFIILPGTTCPFLSSSHIFISH